MNPFKFALGHIVSCRDVSHLLSERQDRELGRFEQWTLAMHLAVCDACTSFEKQMQFLREALRRYRS
jgi:Putative zinc-finger